jgi:hypothetical protein
MIASSATLILELRYFIDYLMIEKSAAVRCGTAVRTFRRSRRNQGLQNIAASAEVYKFVYF